MTEYLLVLFGVLASGIAQIMLKKSGQFEFLKENNFFIYLVLGGIFYVISFGLYLYLLRIFNISKISPFMTVSTMILVVLAGFFIFKEAISFKQGLGICMGIISVFLIFK